MPSSRMLFNFDDGSEISAIPTRDIALSLVGPKSNRSLQLTSGHKIAWPGITLKPTKGVWDGSRFQHLSLDVTNNGQMSFELGIRIDDSGSNDHSDSLTVMNNITPGESRTISAQLYPIPWRPSGPLVLHGMHAAPGQCVINPSKITQIILFLRQPHQEHRFTIDNVRFETPMTELPPEEFLPFIDRFGQFIHADWPGKTHSEQELIDRCESERKELRDHPGPASFDRFGGFKGGPQFEPAKYFRVQQYDGKWWLVDPDGHLFWSHGIDSVSARFGGTGIDQRESYFGDLPPKKSELGQFYHRSNWAFGFYESRIPYTCFNFFAANLYRKYGNDWSTEFADLAHKRLRSWGMNTLACWSDPAIYLQHRTPYTAFFRVERCPTLAGARKMWTQFVDVFDPAFPSAVRHGIETCRESLGDPWCLGFFVDNELYWGDNRALAIWSLQSPANQAAKQVFIEDLKRKYETITALNAVWGTTHETWQDLANETAAPNLKSAEADLQAFSTKFAETYFGVIKGELATAAPGQLYLGCRFIWTNEIATRAACKYCDIVSFNQYIYTVENLRLPEGANKPIFVGEFHFGALDRGMFHPTKVPALNQQHRAECYQRFVRGALAHPLIVGTHWFQYASEPTSGRGDGENYQVGFVDICDTPYHETIAAAREVGHGMYQYRIGR